MKLLRKIAPFAVAALMLGTTVAAADLSNWKASFPAPQTAIVVGANAAAQDVLGMGDIMAALGIAPGPQPSTPTAVKLETSAKKLNIGDNLDNALKTLTKEHLPFMLADGILKNKQGIEFRYTQQLKIEGNAIIDHTRVDDISEKPALYIINEEGQPLVTYSLIFTKGASDFIDKSITIMGKTYVVNSFDNSSLVLMGGQKTVTLKEDEEQTIEVKGKTYTVKVAIITSDGYVKLVINGETTDKLEEGDTYKLEDGTVIGIKEILTQEFAQGKRMVTFYIGAEKIEIVDGEEIKINDEEVEGVFGELTVGSGGELNRIDITYQPEEDVYIYKDNSFKDPAFGAFEIQLKGLETKNVQDIVIKTSGNDKVIVTVPTKHGNVNINAFYHNGSAFHLGKSADYPLVINENATNSSDFNKNTYFIVSKGDESYYMYVKNLKNSDRTVTLRDVLSGQDYVITYPQNSDEGEFTIGSLTVKVKLMTSGTPEGGIDAIDLNADGDYADADIPVITKYGAQVLFDLSNERVVLTEEEDEDNNQIQINVPLAWNNNRIEISQPTATGLDMEEIEDTDKYEDYTAYGTKVWYDSTGQGEVVLSYPDEQAVVAAYITETGVVLGEVGPAVSGSAYAAVDDCNTGLTCIDDVKNMNLIVIGGSAINRVAAELLGLQFPTYGSDAAWQEKTKVDGPGKAIVKLMDSPYAAGKYAMLVAGWEGIDTARATKALKEGTLRLEGKAVLLNTATSTVGVSTVLES